MIRNVYLYGRLSKEFGSKWVLDVQSPVEACHAINVNTNGKFLEVVRNEDIEMEVVRGSDIDSGEILDLTSIQMNSKKGDFHFNPVAKGSGPYALVAVAIIALVGGIVIASMMKTVAPEDAMEEDTKGYSFSGYATSDKQGTPLPLIYGEVYAGPIVISQGLKVEEIK